MTKYLIRLEHICGALRLLIQENIAIETHTQTKLKTTKAYTHFSNAVFS